ncbi:MAG TPA: gliding motility-associated ABC transporter ATP-binding subunit GldA [Flavobacteriales bacterium]|nr:gliding motility-associated ABC transporter ATP-binding subunit GldA [Flavobacteriales bacterium]
MSILVQEVSKLYGRQKVLDNISFEIAKGEVVGFLGPNGAGKTTMMKILTCYIPQTSGSALVCDKDVVDLSVEVRRKVGYLPENNPLYVDMYIKEYLGFIANIHKVSKPKERVLEMVEMTGLLPEQNKKIGALSKGYRQRVGLAQALIHDPEVLILDEPTSGLDPMQLEEVRNLIKSIGKEKTVMFSTHIMQEVEAICDRAIIINKGVIVADGKIDEMQRSLKKSQGLTVEFDREVEVEDLLSIDGVLNAFSKGDNTWKIETNINEDFRPQIFKWAVENEITVLTMSKEEKSLEDIFKELTGN